MAAPTPNTRARAGASVTSATHAYNLADFVSGLEVERLTDDLHTFVDGRRVDDNVHVMMRHDRGARGMFWSSQVAPKK